MAKSPVQRFFESGANLTNMTRKQAESIVKQLVKAGEVRKRDADKVVQSLLDRSRQNSERLSEAVQKEVGKQVGWLSNRFDDIEQRLDDLSTRLAGDEDAESGATSTTAKKAPAKKRAAKKTAAKKSPAKKKAPAKKTAARKRAPAKKAAATEPASSSDAVGSSGVAAVPTSRAARDAAAGTADDESGESPSD